MDGGRIVGYCVFLLLHCTQTRHFAEAIPAIPEPASNRRRKPIETVLSLGRASGQLLPPAYRTSAGRMARPRIGRPEGRTPTIAAKGLGRRTGRTMGTYQRRVSES